ncbi:unnamed protein product [Linum trigynum]|uniref:Mitochondrial protein n=1 Tax=Linum trigynum TaxID=586398 RepID=A0AAV2ETK1_9ROSI
MFHECLTSHFSLKSLGLVGYFLDIEVLPTSNGYVLSQHKYVNDLLDRFDMVDAHLAPSPLSSSAKLTIANGSPLGYLTIIDCSPLAYVTMCKQVLGYVQYLPCTRMHIAFTVNKFSKFMEAPMQLYWQHVKRLLCYLKGTPSLGLLLSSTTTPSVISFANSDWAGYYGSILISWKFKKQRLVAQSSTKVKYRGVAHATFELFRIRNLLCELHQPILSSPVLLCNLGGINFSANLILHSRVKNLALDYLFVRELIQSPTLVVHHIPTTHQLTYFLTKPLSITRF